MATSYMTLLALTATLMFIGGVSTSSLSSLIRNPLRIGAFNIQVFGKTKFGKPDVVKNIVKIAKRYDILLIQEIRDSTEEIIFELQDIINNDLPAEEKYDIVVSERLGRTSSKEQYAFMYKNRKVEMKERYVYNDAATDIFEREPFVVKFQTKAELFDFAMIGCHIKPSDAVNELNNLIKVYDDLLTRDPVVKDAIFMGDFNADCSYVSMTKMETQVTLRSDQRFEWLIGDDVDTTVSATDCAYDRLIIAGEAMAKAYEGGTARVFYFDQEYDLSSSEAKEVSDHYPIEMEIFPPFQSSGASKKGMDTFEDLMRELEEVEELELLKEMLRGSE